MLASQHEKVKLVSCENLFCGQQCSGVDGSVPLCVWGQQSKLCCWAVVGAAPQPSQVLASGTMQPLPVPVLCLCGLLVAAEAFLTFLHVLKSPCGLRVDISSFGLSVLC